MITYDMYSNTNISQKLTNAWGTTRHEHRQSWEQWIQTLSPGIESAEYSNFCTHITFSSEKHKILFILRWT